METFFETRFVGECLHITVLALFLTRCILKSTRNAGETTRRLICALVPPGWTKRARYVFRSSFSILARRTITAVVPVLPRLALLALHPTFITVCALALRTVVAIQKLRRAAKRIHGAQFAIQAAFLILESAGKTRHAVHCSIAALIKAFWAVFAHEVVGAILGLEHSRNAICTRLYRSIWGRDIPGGAVRAVTSSLKADETWEAIKAVVLIVMF